MKTPINSSRCITIVGPSQSGKTSLMESIAHVCKQIHGKGQVKDNNTLSDHLPEEPELKMSISMGISNVQFMDEEYTFIDCPGSNEFINELKSIEERGCCLYHLKHQIQERLTIVYKLQVHKLRLQ